MHIDAHVFLNALKPAIAVHELLTTRQLFVLIWLKANDEGKLLDYNVLYTAMRVSKPAVSRALTALEGLDLVWRGSRQNKGRKAFFTLTVKGHELVQEVLGYAK